MNKPIITVLAFFIMVFLYLTGTSGEMIKEDFTNNRIDSLLKKTELIPIMVNGDKDNRINIVIMNRWTSREAAPYNSPEMKEEFIKDIHESLIAALTPGNEWAHTAYANYREFFNVYGLWFPDMPEWNKGIDVNTVNAMRDKLFLPWKDKYTGWVTFLLMPNLDGGGGIDPLNTPNPMKFCTLMVEFESKVEDCLSVLAGNFEGKIAEMIVLDRKFTEEERKQMEEYLRKKWFSGFDLKF